VLVVCFALLLLWTCGKSAGQNLLVNRLCCHSEHFTPLYHIVFVLLLIEIILFVILNVVIFSLCATTLIKI